MPAASQSLPKTPVLHCVVCDADSLPSEVQTAKVRSNIRKFSQETFALWQCKKCGSIHAADEVDLDYYYAHYPFHDQKMNTLTRLAYKGKLRELEKLGLKREHRVLDYGCGGGVFVQLLQQEGYSLARGYDPYAKEGPYREPPGTGYDVVLSQDVIEHVASPREHLETLKSLTVPGALLFIGTPNAEVVDLDTPGEFIHMLHQPYHLHILTAATIGKLAAPLGMEVVKVKYGFYGNRAFPGINGRFLRRILRTQGDVLDDMVAGIMPKSLALYSPAAIWDALTGAWRDPGHDMTVALRRQA
ncbi:MAG: Methyltransferase type 12 [Myxococcaceae bacterium]|nr:Methyltransferase type 12 [Myxococcaceae bacterium]